MEFFSKKFIGARTSDINKLLCILLDDDIVQQTNATFRRSDDIKIAAIIAP